MSTSQIDVIYNELLTTLDEQGMSYFPSMKDKKLKVAQLIKSDSDETKEWFNYQIEFQDAGLDTVCVEFKRLGGSQLAFHKHFDLVMTQIGSSYIDTALL